MDETLERLRAEFAAALDGLDAAETQLRPDRRPDAWTVQQIVEHLMMTYASTADTMKVRLQRGSPTKAKATVTNCAAQFVVGRLGYFPAGRKAPEMVTPASPTQRVMDGAMLSEAFAASLEAMDEKLTEVSRVLGDGRAVSHTVLGPMSIPSWRRFHLAHGRHHLKQVRRILKSGRMLRESETVLG